ncbi:hypothetical protein K440DRAFT_553831 [Wilcoxina mikolae CBS 423.85]|nr:hypothetical protein K440DRAFT_553831 [Wilcoxina mikolae CBS 423.85]
MEKVRRYPTSAIDDKSKSDYLAKVLTCSQASWIVLQCLGRKMQGLPTTLLELNTVVHVLNAFVLYILWWEKPADVGRPSTIDMFRYEDEATSFAGMDVLKESLRTVSSNVMRLVQPYEPICLDAANAMHAALRLDDTLEYIAGRIARGVDAKQAFGRRWQRQHRIILLLFSGMTGAFYGGMHSIKWNDTFPTKTEGFLWKISSCIGMAGILPILACSLAYRTRYSKKGLWYMYIVIGLVSGVVFLAARLYLIVECLLSLRALPPSAYDTVRWSEWIPHI